MGLHKHLVIGKILVHGSCVVVRMDLTQGTNSNKIRIYVNGVLIFNFNKFTTVPSSSTRWASTANRIGVGDAVETLGPFLLPRTDGRLSLY